MVHTRCQALGQMTAAWLWHQQALKALGLSCRCNYDMDSKKKSRGRNIKYEFEKMY